ncbi:MAG TPA: hypothetical protein VEZ47_00345 [Gemmatirosa sp.]|nr:hypothetical protein [Gemmatirosa sp.]
MSPAEFIAQYGDSLAHNLGHHVLVASQELCAALAERGELPEGVTAERLLPVLLSLRATLELMAVDKRHGTAAHDALVAAMRDYYNRTLLARGDFLSGIRAAHETMRRSSDARDWPRLHAEALLGTREPEHALFHTALVYGLRRGDAIADVLDANLAEARGPGAPAA